MTKTEIIKSFMESIAVSDDKAVVIMEAISTIYGEELSLLEEIQQSFLESELEAPRRVYGRTFQYDSGEGKYYEPSADSYASHDDFSDIESRDQNAQRAYQSRIKAGIENAESAKDINYLINAKSLYWDTNSAKKAEAFAMKLSGDIDPKLAEYTMRSLDESNLMEDDNAMNEAVDISPTKPRQKRTSRKDAGATKAEKGRDDVDGLWVGEIEHDGEEGGDQGTIAEQLAIPKGKTVSGYYAGRGTELAKDLLDSNKGDKRRTAGQLGFPANTNASSKLDVFRDALAHLPELEGDADEGSKYNKGGRDA